MNVEGAINLFEAMRLVSVKRVVHISTEETYGDFQSPLIDEEHPQKPVSVYGVTKLAVEHYGRVYSRDHGLECINVRTCWVYGPDLPRLRVPRTFIEAALRGEPHHLAEGGDLAVDQVHISDTVAGVLLALDKPQHRFDSYNIATGKAPTRGRRGRDREPGRAGCAHHGGEQRPLCPRRHGAQRREGRAGHQPGSRRAGLRAAVRHPPRHRSHHRRDAGELRCRAPTNQGKK